MKFSNILLAGAIFLATAPSTTAAQSEQPILEFHTTLYELHGEQNAFHFYLGTKTKDYYDIDCGFGTQEYEIEPAVFDGESQGLAGTVITGTVNKDGWVKVYGDPANIDYINLDGCYINEIRFPKLTNVEILDLQNNELKALDLTDMHKLQALYLNNNPFTAETPLIVGPDKPDLTILSLSIIDHMDSSFSLRDYPSLVSFEAWNNKGLTVCDPTGCPELMRISIDVTPVSRLDVSKNSKLLILNISETRIPSIDISNNPYLTEFYANHTGRANNDVHLTELELGSKPEMVRLFVADNRLSKLDVSGCPKLVTFNCAGNLLSSIDISGCPLLYEVNISRNNMDYVTIPAPRETFGEYYYSQRPFSVERSYPIGTTIDFSDRVNRPNSTTKAKVYKVDEADILNPIELDHSYYTYEDGRLTLLAETTDSVYVSFTNTTLPEYPMTTGKFLVKSAETYGKPSVAATLSISSTVKDFSMAVGISGATVQNPVSFFVDFGDGLLTEFSANTTLTPDEDNVNGTRKGNGEVKIYTVENSDLTALAIRDVSLLRTDLSAARSLSELEIARCRLARIDLTWNRCLTSLNLSGNTLSTLDLSTENGAYGKNVLSSINLSGNRLTEIEFNDHRTLLDLDISGNQLTTLSTRSMSNLLTLNVADNLLEDLSLQDCEALTHLDASGNLLTGFTIPAYTPLASLNLSGNNITLPALPAADAVASYTYAPQRDIVLPSKAPSINLSAEWLDIDGLTTTYSWFKADGDTPLASSQIEGDKGRFTFLDTNMGEVYCTISHPAFPAFDGANAIHTTRVEAAAMPTNMFASFTTLEADTANLTLTAARQGTAVYVDWKGNGDLEQYPLTTVYTSFPVVTTENASVKFYSYDADEGLTVFSFGGVRIKDLDASRMKNLIAFTSDNTGLTEQDIKLPESPGLTELNLYGNNFSSLDWIEYPELYMLILTKNNLSSLDLTRFKKLGIAHAADNTISEVRLDNPDLWELNLTTNDLRDIDLSGAPSILQLWLSNNYLSAIDVAMLKNLNVLFLDGNSFTFATLPSTDRGYNIYNFRNQRPIEATVSNGKVDLSSQATVDGTETVYRWFIDSPYLDENGELAGEELVQGEEFTVENGVTTFLSNFNHIMCVMTNTRFPGLYMMTDFINVTASGITDITTDIEEASTEYFNLQGIRVENPGPGIYIRRRGNEVSKILVK